MTVGEAATGTIISRGNRQFRITDAFTDGDVLRRVIDVDMGHDLYLESKTVIEIAE